MSSDSSNEFSKWFNNPDQRSAREKAMLMSGIPLEIKTRRFLTRNGYRVTRWYYPSKPETARELDFIAEKVLGRYTFPLSEYPFPEERRIDFWIVILGECKRSSTHDCFAFEAEQPERTLRLSRFPVPFYRQMDAPPYTFVIGSLSSLMHHYSFPFVADRIVEVDANNFKTRQGDNYGDTRTHEACETLLSASINLKENYQSQMDKQTQQIFASFQQEYLEISKKMLGSTTREVAKELVETDLKQAWKKLPYFFISWGVPLIVLDDNRGLISTILREDESVEFKEDLGFVLYPYVSENIQNFQRIGARGSFPVIICKNASLPETLKIIEAGTAKLIEQCTAWIKNKPEDFIEQLLVTEIERQRKKEVASQT